jgi:uncharacterized protein YcfJ
MNKTILAVSALTAALTATSTLAQVTLYRNEAFRGRTITVNDNVDNLYYYGFNDRASSIVVQRGRWEVCSAPDFGGRCVVLRSGQYPTLGAMGLDDRVSSVRRVRGRPPQYVSEVAPPAGPGYDYYPRHGERLYQADVVAVRAVVGPPEQRCWVERDYYAGRNDPNVPAAIIGGILGGVLGHQIGGGSGRDVATALGAIGGAAVGANVDGSGRYRTGEVQRCATAAPSGPPQYYDVSYVFRGREYRAQLGFAPGPTITVNAQGEPRA